LYCTSPIQQNKQSSKDIIHPVIAMAYYKIL
jgi:hypothetical protein